MKSRIQRRFGAKLTESAGDAGPISGRKRKGELTVAGRIAVGLFFSVFLVVGLGTAYAFTLRPWVSVWKARDWTPVTCHILSSEVSEHRGSDSTTYGVAIAYVYEVEGRSYEGKRYDFSMGSSSGRRAKREIVERYREGAEAVCYVNPENPGEAVIERTRIRDWGFGFIPLVFVAVGMGGVVFAIRGPRKNRASGREWPKTRATYETVFTGRSAGGADYSDEGLFAGPVELKPAVSRLGGLVAISLFTLFWNGIVSVFLVNIIGDAMRGGAIMWVFLIFLLPFVGIGLFMFGLSVRTAMSLANPVPRLTVNKRAFEPGETVKVAWRFDGARTRLRDLRLWLEGREEATYRRGTDTKTDKEVFATFEIGSVTGLSAGEPGEAALRLPERLMHSFKSDNNQIVWRLCVKGGIARWPDLNEEFSFTIVVPRRASAAVAVDESVSSQS